jgi:hypothetical protein
VPALPFRFDEPLPDALDRFHPLAVFSVDVRELLGNGVAILLTSVDEPNAVLESVELVEEPAQESFSAPKNKRGGPLRGRPFPIVESAFFVGLFRLKLSVPLFRGPHLVGPLGFEPRSDRL